MCVEQSDDLDRDQFRRRILDDPINRQLKRVVSYPVRARGRRLRLHAAALGGRQLVAPVSPGLPC